MRVHFVDLGLVHEAHDLDIIRSFRELNASDGAVRHDTSSMTWLGTPSNHLTLNLANSATRGGRCPKAEIYKGSMTLGSTWVVYVPSRELMTAVWHSDVGPSVVELHLLYPTWSPRASPVELSALYGWKAKIKSEGLNQKRRNGVPGGPK